MDDIYIARQPVYDTKLEVMGYEILYRSNEDNRAQFVDGDKASSDAIVNSFIHIGIDNLVGTALAFVNLPTEFITNREMVPMFHEQTVLEILENVEPTDEVITGIKRLKSQGFKIALDDFTYRDELIPLIELADYIKLDVLITNSSELEALFGILGQYNVKIVAEKVETQELYKHCQQFPFDYYQGFFFCRPQMVAQKNPPASKVVVLNLLNKIQDTETDYDEIEQILSQDVTLSYKLLRYINSAAFSLRREIESIKDALVLLGLDSIRNWLSLILMSRVADDKPQQLVVTALVRARMAEQLSHHLLPGFDKPMFTCGLFSVLDALMDKPMIDLLDTVILSTGIKLALLDFDGEFGRLLQQVIWYELGRFDELEKDDVEIEKFSEAYLNAVKWADQSILALS